LRSPVEPTAAFFAREEILKVGERFQAHRSKRECQIPGGNAMLLAVHIPDEPFPRLSDSPEKAPCAKPECYLCFIYVHLLP
jgi:hypothetical protein